MATHEKSKRPSRTHKYQSVLIALAGVILIIAGLTMVYDRYSATHGTTPLPDPKQTINTAVAAPSEKKPDADSLKQYTVPADQPRSLTIEPVGINGLIQKVGVTKDQAMATPSSIFYAGWYTGSVEPGQPGLSIINGHVSGKYADGIFKKLLDVKTGNVISVEFGDKSIKKFSVVDTTKLPDSQAAAYLFTKRPGIGSQLDLITCGGKFDNTTQTFNDRVIVVAKLLGT